MLGIVKRNFIYLTLDSFVVLYKAMIRSHLEYAVSVWNPHHQSLIEKLEKVQKRSTKLVIDVEKLHYPRLSLTSPDRRTMILFLAYCLCPLVNVKSVGTENSTGRCLLSVPQGRKIASVCTEWPSLGTDNYIFQALFSIPQGRKITLSMS